MTGKYLFNSIDQKESAVINFGDGFWMDMDCLEKRLQGGCSIKP